MSQKAKDTILPVVVSEGMFAIPEGWLLAHRDDRGFISLEDAQELRDALHDAIQDEIVRRRQPWKEDI